MSLLSSATVLRVVDSVAIVLGQAYQLAGQGLTPREAWEGRCLPAPVPIRTRDQLPPRIKTCRGDYFGDPRLPLIDISVQAAA